MGLLHCLWWGEGNPPKQRSSRYLSAPKARSPGEARGGCADLVVINLHFSLRCLELDRSVLCLLGPFPKLWELGSPCRMPTELDPSLCSPVVTHCPQGLECAANTAASRQRLLPLCHCLGMDPGRMHLALEPWEVLVSELSSLLTLHTC